MSAGGARRVIRHRPVHRSNRGCASYVSNESAPKDDTWNRVSRSRQRTQTHECLHDESHPVLLSHSMHPQKRSGSKAAFAAQIPAGPGALEETGEPGILQVNTVAPCGGDMRESFFWILSYHRRRHPMEYFHPLLDTLFLPINAEYFLLSFLSIERSPPPLKHPTVQLTHLS